MKIPAMKSKPMYKDYSDPEKYIIARFDYIESMGWASWVRFSAYRKANIKTVTENMKERGIIT